MVQGRYVEGEMFKKVGNLKKSIYLDSFVDKLECLQFTVRGDSLLWLVQ